MLPTAFLCSLLLSGQPAPPPSGSDKVSALQSAVCVLPYGQTIDAREVPQDLCSPFNWMARLKDDAPISLVSIPATHDAGTALARTGWTRCQVTTIAAQVALGIRGFDIRLRLVDDKLGVYHNEESQKLPFEKVMTAFRSLLRAHPEEFVIMRVREESKALRSHGTFEEAFGKVTNSPQFGGMFFRADSRTQIPTVRQVRGRIVLLDNYGKLPAAIDYPNPTMEVQDDYDTSDMAKKYAEIVAGFEHALEDRSGSKWHVGYTSSSTLKVDQLASARANNGKVEDFLFRKKGPLGLVFMNFPGAKVIREIIDSNL